VVAGIEEQLVDSDGLGSHSPKQRIAIAKIRSFSLFLLFRCFRVGCAQDIFQQAEKVVIGNWFFQIQMNAAFASFQFRMLGLESADQISSAGIQNYTKLIVIN
jgi:hypothetical protein